MKKLIYILAALLVSPAAILTARADAASDAVLAKVRTTLAAKKAYEVQFTVSSDEFATISGMYVVNSTMYYMVLGENKIICDGKARYEIRSEEQEVIIDKFDPKDHSILSNPPRAFDYLDGTYTHKLSGKTAVNGKECDVVSLTPVDPAAMMPLKLYVERASGLPVRLEYGQGDVSFLVDIAGIKDLAAADAALFRYDAKKYKDYEQIDFR